MNMKKLLERIAQLEFINDQIYSELQSTDKLLREIGFSEGLKTVKEAAQEILEQEQEKQKKAGKDKPRKGSGA